MCSDSFLLETIMIQIRRISGNKVDSSVMEAATFLSVIQLRRINDI